MASAQSAESRRACRLSLISPVPYPPIMGEMVRRSACLWIGWRWRRLSRISKNRDTARPLTRTAAADLSLCCLPLPVGEEIITLLHAQQRNPPLSHRERHAAVQRFDRRDVG